MQGIRRLFAEYGEFLGPEVVCHAGLGAEIENLPGEYSPPGGGIWVAESEGEVHGCIGLRRIGDGVAEIKRLFVRDRLRGTGAGRMLADAAIGAARTSGYRCIRLDTLPERMPAAQKLYRRLGFREIGPYNDHAVPGTKFFELDLCDEA
jgi:GNAT superfamily N-acetyltransferase